MSRVGSPQFSWMSSLEEDYVTNSHDAHLNKSGENRQTGVLSIELKRIEEWCKGQEVDNTLLLLLQEPFWNL